MTLKQRNHRSLGNPSVLALVATVAFTACGGGGSGSDGTVASTAGDLEKHVVVSPGPSNLVSKWNEIAFNTAAVPVSPGGATPEERVAGPDVTTVQLAVYDAAMAVAATHKPYAIVPATSVAGAGLDAMQAAVIESAYRVLKGLFPSRGSLYEAAYVADMSAVPDGEGKVLGRQAASEVAAGILALRANDGRETVLPAYVPGTGPGQFRGINPVNRIAPYIRPFTTTSHSQFRPPAPYSVQSAAYAADLNEIKAIAGQTSTQRTPAQEEIARFYTEPPSPYTARNMRQFATANATLADNARVLAMLWTGWTDALSGCFEAKYHYNFWRPTSGINFADTDDNPLTQVDSTWVPFVTTPNHPEYPAAHTCGGAAMMEALRSFYGTKNITFDFTSTVTGTTHHFSHTEHFLDEVRNGRVWGGMHFRTSADAGIEQAKNVTQWMTQRYFQRVD